MIIAFTGAGVSAASGVPTFQERPGIRDKLTRAYARRHPEKHKAVLDGMLAAARAAEPNPAHLSLAAYGIPVITMNVDGLHARAGSEHVLEIHGNLERGDVVLYGDPAPLYSEAETWVSALGPDDLFLVAGTSFYTGVSGRLRDMAKRTGCRVLIIGHAAEVLLPEALEDNKDRMGGFARLREMIREAGEAVPPVPPPYSGGWNQI